MKLGKAFGMLGASAILFVSSAFAADKGNMKLFEPTTVSGVQLAPGDYELQWEGTGSDVQVKVIHGKKVLATTSAKLVQLSAPASQNMTSTRSAGDHGKALSEVSFRGKNYALAIAESASGSTDVASK